MKRLERFKNKYIITIVVFAIYALFIDDVDVFSIARKEIKLSKLKQESEDLTTKYNTVKKTLDELDDIDALERFARENKMFKKDEEDIFVIVNE